MLGFLRFLIGEGHFDTLLCKFTQHPKLRKEIILTADVIIYEDLTDTWDAHTFVSFSLVVGGTVATMFAACVVVAGIALYGIDD
ncbi:hypothetical protein L950_0216095 [Sphingobacterium sp. IITKGP-BTPF85]|nr:hypothetical protein L950_0216095 [Sphingobacterium sp. IITKGP-BTPF85]